MYILFEFGQGAIYSPASVVTVFVEIVCYSLVIFTAGGTSLDFLELDLQHTLQSAIFADHLSLVQL